MSETSLSTNTEGVPLLSDTHSRLHEAYSTDIQHTEGPPELRQQTDLIEHTDFQETTYKRRWWILLVFCFCAVSYGVFWNTWPPLSDVSEIAFGWEVTYTATITSASNVALILLGFPLMYVVESRGLRMSLVIAVSMLVLGSALWIVALSTSQHWLVIVGAFVSGIAPCILMAASPLISVVWFPVSERTTATAIAAVSAHVGVSLAHIIGPLVSGTRVTADELLYKNATAGHVAELQFGLQKTVYFDSGLAVLCFILVLAYFPSKPPKPPSRSQTIQHDSFWQGMKHLSKNTQFWILSMAYNISNGTFNSWILMISINFRSMNIGEVAAGWIGFTSMISACVSAVVMSLVADRFQRKTKGFLKAVSVCSIALLAILACIQERWIDVPQRYMIGVLYVICIPLTMCIHGVIPLYYELACEYAYPVHEGLACVVILVVNFFIGILFFSISYIPGLKDDTKWMTWTSFGACLISLPLLTLLKDRYDRLDLDTGSKGSE